ncbi:hypothetical protein CMU81_02485 [Elizabethkingia anophelis]|uniref:Uncharacterized protein n=1 Tax=Elizabethkingia anophelis TaxID=1117645 RepID=A0A494JBU6_9FLAO|nr:hypothetical protein AYC66_17845 [Elizabethkingia anophelis]MDV3470847.1 hypothetical protein [Elizabethkingia anophelis]MDV3536835.1 hypothetical protein [Elizabethkingia anophelis]MDV3554556.1 hypothetical protein [Elizabethkingia anophelis]MDV3612693.1 hypothetical protein [Elizabethkingia anophelis]
MKQIFALFKFLSAIIIFAVVFMISIKKVHEFIIQLFNISYNKDDPSSAYVLTMFLSVFISLFVLLSILIILEKFYKKKIEKAVFKIFDSFFED